MSRSNHVFRSRLRHVSRRLLRHLSRSLLRRLSRHPGPQPLILHRTHSFGPPETPGSNAYFQYLILVAPGSQPCRATYASAQPLLAGPPCRVTDRCRSEPCSLPADSNKQISFRSDIPYRRPCIDRHSQVSTCQNVCCSSSRVRNSKTEAEGCNVDMSQTRLQLLMGGYAATQGAPSMIRLDAWPRGWAGGDTQPTRSSGGAPWGGSSFGGRRRLCVHSASWLCPLQTVNRFSHKHL